MKHATVKSIGAAALGAAFAASAAGAASAAPAPVDDVLSVLPANATELLPAGTNALQGASDLLSSGSGQQLSADTPLSESTEATGPAEAAAPQEEESVQAGQVMEKAGDVLGGVDAESLGNPSHLLGGIPVGLPL